MADFYQSRVIATFHKLGQPNLDQLESELEYLSKKRNLSLVLPALFSEFEREALPNILEELKRVNYIHEIVLVLGKADADQFAHACSVMQELSRERVSVIWLDSPRIMDVLRTIENQDLYIGEDGKGRAVWVAYGYILGKGETRIIAQHDCDIVTYDRNLLARLVYPAMNRNLGFQFVKGYYARVTNRMYGRVTRLFVSPLIRALVELVGHHPFLTYLDDFRYPLAGEVAMTSDLARLNRIPGGWGQEVGTLAEVYRNVPPKRVCQVDLSESYEHKHQPLSPDDPEKGLLKMCIDIATSIFNTLASAGVVFGEGIFKSLNVAYLLHAQDTIWKFAGDATLNGLEFDRHEEGLAVETFARGLEMGGQYFMENPTGKAQIPNWSRVADALPEIQQELVDAVASDYRVK